MDSHIDFVKNTPPGAKTAAQKPARAKNSSMAAPRTVRDAAAAREEVAGVPITGLSGV
jgi:hypothetical protein